MFRRGEPVVEDNAFSKTPDLTGTLQTSTQNQSDEHLKQNKTTATLHLYSHTHWIIGFPIFHPALTYGESLTQWSHSRMTDLVAQSLARSQKTRRFVHCDVAHKDRFV
eukprot:s2262_g9.t1